MLSPQLIGVAAVVLLVAAGALIYYLRLPSDAAKLIAAGVAARDASDFAVAEESFRLARGSTSR